MEQQKPFINIHKLAKAFQKIYAGLNKEQLDELDKELLKMYPSEESEVLFSSDYDNDANSIGISIYISKPILEENVEKMTFDNLIFAYLVRADLSKLPQVFSCIALMERKEGIEYAVDFIPVFYTKAIDKHDIHFRIIKN